MRALLVVAALLLISGCTAITDFVKGGWDHSSSQISAPTAQKGAAGSSAGAKMAKKTSGRKAARGEDEMLFREALLSLKPSRETLVTKRGRKLLSRLKKEYPASPWTAQAAPLIELIRIADELSNENKDLKTAQESLARKVEELNRNIEQMKNLDMELEESR